MLYTQKGSSFLWESFDNMHVQLTLGYTISCECRSAHCKARARPVCIVHCSCTISQAQYTCPRCHMRYCALECYRRHNVHCTAHLQQCVVVWSVHVAFLAINVKHSSQEALQVVARVFAPGLPLEMLSSALHPAYSGCATHSKFQKTAITQAVESC
jgi:hypothetical protein